MIFRIGMPIIEDLMNWLDSDDNDRSDVKRVLTAEGPGKWACVCNCASTVTSASNWYSSLQYDAG